MASVPAVTSTTEYLPIPHTGPAQRNADPTNDKDMRRGCIQSAKIFKILTKHKLAFYWIRYEAFDDQAKTLQVVECLCCCPYTWAAMGSSLRAEADQGPATIIALSSVAS